ncbi:MAG: tRNA (adenosine(37)-N6)-threonylcarbamoyltransferase complex dimerization subunit type 1 TsaB, partial [Bacilli bacterium]|nr:tRNA (adenosine(37)-N6)-threonylcarbamoyltransferase complex dimerization subunit type 1 TsaB [Bacilli bacterium]
MYTLFIDTHDKNVLIILYKDGKIVSNKDVQSVNKHSEITMPVLDNVLSESGVSVNELDNVIVVNGPGSFTGERIAVTIGKTISYCLNIPIRVIDSLTILALNINKDSKIVAVEDRNGAYVGEFDKDNNKVSEFKYLNKSSYEEYKNSNEVLTNVDVNYELVY